MLKSYISTLVLLLFLSASCQNKNNKTIIENYSETKDANSLQSILINHKAKLVEINRELNINGKKEILNELMKNNNFFSNSNYKITLIKLQEAKIYFENIFNKNDIVFKNTLNKISQINQNKLNQTQKSKIYAAQSSITLIKGNGIVYNININLLINKLLEAVNQVEDCKHEVKNNEVLFYDEECLEKYDKLITEIQKIQIECNNIKSKYNEIESIYN
jgi:hypothetical protein